MLLPCRGQSQGRLDRFHLNKILDRRVFRFIRNEMINSHEVMFTGNKFQMSGFPSIYSQIVVSWDTKTSINTVKFDCATMFHFAKSLQSSVLIHFHICLQNTEVAFLRFTKSRNNIWLFCSSETKIRWRFLRPTFCKTQKWRSCQINIFKKSQWHHLRRLSVWYSALRH